MKVIEKEVCIPAKTYVDRTYIATDRTEFSTKQSCLDYEKRLAIQSHPVYASCIKDIIDFTGDWEGRLYYISSLEDHDFFMKTQGFNEFYFNSDFNQHGAGWYIFYIVDGGDYDDVAYLENYNVYINKVESSLQYYKKNIEKKIKQKHRG